MFGPITIPYEAVMLYNVCKLKDGLEWSDELEFAIGEMCTVVKETYDDFIAGQVLKYAGFISQEGSVGGCGPEGNHFALITYWKSFDAHEASHRAERFMKAFGGVLEFCNETKELGYEMMWQGEK
jgi:hypothetical protein|tara:strand:+ start:108 stop:482 length:375 start_codon:yes stop_codon:yes gene_type:complete